MEVGSVTKRPPYLLHGQAPISPRHRFEDRCRVAGAANPDIDLAGEADSTETRVGTQPNPQIAIALLNRVPCEKSRSR